MTQAKDGNTVKVHYTGTLNDGTVFDSSKDREPLEFKVGSGMLIADFENSVDGMEVGQSKTINIPADKAYGNRIDEMVQEIELDQLPKDQEPEIGQELDLVFKDGRKIPFTITKIDESKVILDGNHPLAGEDLTFDIELVEIA